MDLLGRTSSQGWNDAIRNFSSSLDFAFLCFCPFSDQLSLNDHKLAPGITKLVFHPMCQLQWKRTHQKLQQNSFIVSDCLVWVMWLPLNQSLEPNRSCTFIGKSRFALSISWFQERVLSAIPKIRVILSEARTDSGLAKTTDGRENSTRVFRCHSS